MAKRTDKSPKSDEPIAKVRIGVAGLDETKGESPKVFSLQGTETPYRVLVEAMNEGMAALGGDDSILYANHRLAELAGRPLESLTGGSILDACVPNNRDHLQELLAAGKSERAKAEFTLRQPGGRTVPVLLSVSPLNLPDGAGLCLVATDLTEQRHTADAFQKAKEAMEQRVAEQTAGIRRKSAYNRSLIEASLDPLVTIGPDGKITDVNGATERVTGLDRGELIGSDFSDYFTEPDRARAGYEQVFREGLVRDYPLEIRHGDGHTVPVLYNATVYRDEAGEVIGVFAAARDITEVKKAEAALQELNATLEQRVAERTAELATFLDAVPTPVIIVHDVNGAHMTGNRAADELLRHAHGNEVSLSAPPETRPSHFKAVKDGRELSVDELPAQRAARGEQVRDFEFSLIFDDGTTRHVLGYGTPLRDADGRPRGAVHVLVDITERKRAEEALRQSQETLEAFFAASPGILNIEDDSFRYIKTDSLTPTYLGLDRNTIVGKSVEDLAPEFIGEFGDMMREVVETGQPKLNIETKSPVPSRPNEIAYWRASYFPVPLAGGKRGIGIMGVEITDMKKAEEALRASESRERERAEELATFLDAAPTPVFVVHDPDGKHITGNRAADELLRNPRGAEASLSAPGETKPHHFKAVKDGRELRTDELPAQRAARGEQVRDFEFSLVFDDGTIRHVLGYGTPLRDADGRPRGAVHVLVDVTERKQAEEALRESEARFRALTETTSLAVGVSSSDGKFLYLNKAYEKLFGYTLEELNHLNASELWRDPEGRRKMVDAIRPKGFLMDYEVELKRKDGTPFWALLSVNSVDYGGNQAIMASVYDITERKQAEAAVRQSEERFRSVAENMSEGLMLFDPQVNLIYQNAASLRIHGYSVGEDGRMAHEDLPVTWQAWDDQGRPITFDQWPVSRAFRGERFQNQVLRVLRPETGLEFDASYNGCPIYDAAGKLVLAFITIRDITEQRTAEMALRESEARFRLALRNAPVSVAAQDRDLRFIWAYNQRSAKPEQIIGHFDDDIFTAEEAAHFTAIKRRVLDEGIEHREQLWLDRPTGRMFLDICWEPMHDSAGRIIGVASATVDHTPIKLAEGALLEAHRRLQSQAEELKVLNEELHQQTEELLSTNEQLRGQEQALQESVETQRRTAERFRLLSDAASSLLAAVETQPVIEHLCQEVMKFLDCQVFFNLLVDEQTRRLHLNACAGIPKKERKKIEWLDYGVAVCGCVARDGRRLIAEHISDTEEERITLVRSFGIEAYACHPIMVGSQVLGTLSFGTKTRQTFTEDDLSLMKTVTDMVAIAVQRRQMEGDLRQLNERLEQQVDQRTEALAETIDRLEEEVKQRALMGKELQRRSQMLEGFFQHTITPLAFMDKNFNFVRVNDAYARADRKRPEEFVGRNHFELYPNEENEEIFKDVVRTKEPYHAHARPFRYPGQPQRVTYCNWLLTPLHDEAGEVQSLVLNLEDVTDRQKAFEELERRASQLQRLTMELSQAEDRERQRLAQILHDDLQQLLVGAKLHLNILTNKIEASEEAKELLSQIRDLISESIDKSRSLSHELTRPLLYQGALSDAFVWLGQQMRQTCGLTVEVDAVADTDLSSDALKAFMYKAAQEMLFNVVKHAQVKQAKLQLRRLKEYVRVVVSDEGRGFDPSTLERASGFGLFSIQERARLLGGWMKFKSTPGSGSIFVLAIPDNQKTEDRGQEAEMELPFPEASPPSPVVRRGSAGHPLRVMLVDDHKVMREGVATLLDEQPDIEVIGQAGNGRDAVSMARRLRPDVIIMDVTMPIMDGEEATRKIKAQLPQTRIIGLSLSEKAAVAEKMRRAGAECYISKTDPSETLLAAIRGQPPEDR